ncbi:MAG: EamA family transporter, partial [Firmicutes bacterium]|nr:EamA family transporter [Bacillota bacterium]
RLIGATRASMIDSMEPLSSAVLGYILLGQGLDIYTVTGSALMIVSILLLLRQKKNSES